MRLPTVRNEFSINESLNFAWSALKKNFWFLLSIQYAIGAGAAGIIGLIRTEPLRLLSLTVYASFITGGFLSILLKIIDGGSAEFADLTSKSKLWWRFLLANFITLLLLGVGSLLFLVPGLIAILHTCFSGFCIIENASGPIAALKRSSELTRGCRLKLLLFLVLLITVAGTGIAFSAAALVTCLQLRAFAALAGIFLFGLIMATVFIYCELAWVHCYRQLTSIFVSAEAKRDHASYQ